MKNKEESSIYKKLIKSYPTKRTTFGKISDIPLANDSISNGIITYSGSGITYGIPYNPVTTNLYNYGGSFTFEELTSKEMYEEKIKDLLKQCLELTKTMAEKYG
jgi:hypothetical protein